MSKFIILATEGAQDEEMIVPYYTFSMHFPVIVVSHDGLNFKGKYGVPYRGKVTNLDDMYTNLDTLDIIYCCGGFLSPELMRQQSLVLESIKMHNSYGGLITAICHGPQILTSSGICKGRKMTCYKGMKDDLINAGADYQEKDVVVDDNIITSPHYNQLPIFMKTVIQHYHLRNSVVH